jgi:hypothetical protein
VVTAHLTPASSQSGSDRRSVRRAGELFGSRLVDRSALVLRMAFVEDRV